ncbi:MAG TPA: Calx-beta domain-containing protein, partial [Acidimicrobiales bacterium]|nr:Calx-beta domain-containing protein [Acidimicrobiales bacterium]
MYATGGFGLDALTAPFGSTVPALGTVEAYEPTSGKWTTLAGLSTPRARHGTAAAVGRDGKERIYAFGGVASTFARPVVVGGVEEYDPDADTWVQRAPMPTPRFWVAAATATGPDGRERIYVIGGYTADGTQRRLSAVVEAYDPTTDTWASSERGELPPMAVPRARLGAATGPDGRVYAIGGVIGGFSGAETTEIVEAFDVAGHTWSDANPMNTKRGALAAATGPDARIYAIGGPGATVEAYSAPSFPTTSTSSTTTTTLPGSGSGVISPRCASALESVASSSESGAMPLSFEPNAGQSDPSARFLARSPNGTAFFTSQGVVLSLAGASPEAPSQALSLAFVGAQPAPNLTAGTRQKGRVNYFDGSDPSRWITNLATYNSVTYGGLYPGIDLVYDGPEGSLKGTYTVTPGADPAAIRWRWGPGVPSLQPDGSLAIGPGGGAPPYLVEKAPVAWQDHPRGRQAVDVSFEVAPDATVGFALGDFDPALPLVIDPTVLYATYLGGNNQLYDNGGAIAIDDNCDVYLGGRTSSPDFPTTPMTCLAPGQHPCAYQGTPRTTGAPGFVTKLRPSGKGRADMVWSTYLGAALPDPINGGEQVFVQGIAVDADHNVYAAGSLVGTSFPTTANAAQGRYGGGFGDMFLTKLNSTGSALLYSSYLGGSGYDGARCPTHPPAGFWYCHYPAQPEVSLAIDGDGGAYVAGPTSSTDFPMENPMRSHNESGHALVKVAPSGDLAYSTYLDPPAHPPVPRTPTDNRSYPGPRGPTGLAVDTSGNAYVTYGMIFLGPEKVALASIGGITQKISASGRRAWQEPYPLGGNDLALGPDGSVFVTGATQGLAVTNDAAQPEFRRGHTTDLTWDAAPEHGTDAFVARIDATGKHLLYSTYLGGGGNETGRAIAVDHRGHAFVTGSTSSCDFPVSNAFQPARGDYGGQVNPPGCTNPPVINCGSFHENCNAPSDAFVAEFDMSPQLPSPADQLGQVVDQGGSVVSPRARGSTLVWSSYLGGTRGEVGNGITVDGRGNAYVVGTTNSRDFPMAGSRAAPAKSPDPCAAEVPVSPPPVPFQPAYAPSQDLFSSNAFMAKIGDSPPVPPAATSGACGEVVADDTGVGEPATGEAVAVFGLRRHSDATAPLTVAYTTADGTAEAGQDYRQSTGTAVFGPGQTDTTVRVAVLADAEVEPEQSFKINLSLPTGAGKAVLAQPSATATIVDFPRAISIGDVSVGEPLDSSVPATFTVTLSEPAVGPVSARYATADASAKAGSDYQAASGTVSIPAGATTAEVTVAVLGDGLAEADEEFLVELSEPAGARLGRSAGKATIFDALPGISAGHATVVEGDAGMTPARFTVTANAEPTQAVSVHYATKHASAGPEDYRPASGRLSFGPGERSKVLIVEVVADTLDEADEEFFLVLSEPAGTVVARAV